MLKFNAAGWYLRNTLVCFLTKLGGCASFTDCLSKGWDSSPAVLLGPDYVCVVDCWCFLAVYGCSFFSGWQCFPL